MSIWRWFVPCYIPFRAIAASLNWCLSRCLSHIRCCKTACPHAPPASWPFIFTTVIAIQRALLFSFVIFPVSCLKWFVARTSQQTWMPHIYDAEIIVKKTRSPEPPGEWIRVRSASKLSLISQSPAPPSRVVLYVHGGAFALCTPATHRGITVGIVQALRQRGRGAGTELFALR